MTGIHDAARALVLAVADCDRAAIVAVLGHDPGTGTGAPAGTADYLSALCIVLAESVVDDERALAAVMTAPKNLDEIAIERRLNGESVYLNAAEIREAARIGHRRGMEANALGRSLGMSGSTIRRLVNGYKAAS